MRAVVFQGVGEPMTVEEVDRPELPDDGVIIETEACGVCRSDWHAWQGDMGDIGFMPTEGLVFGHEPVGTIAETGPDVETFSEGDRVTNSFILSDGSCLHCRRGNQNRCERAIPMGFVPFSTGAFAEEYPVRTADTNLVEVPAGTDPVGVAGLGCRFSTAFHGLVHRVDVTAGDWVAVHGCGGVGLSAVHVADALGANVIALDLKQASLDMAENLGADRTVKVDEVQDVPQTVKGFTPKSRGADVSVDALGIAATCRNSINSLGKGGQHLQIGLTSGEEDGEVAIPIDIMVNDEREFYGSFGMPPHEYDEIFQMMAEDELDPSGIVSETISLADVPATIEAMSDYDTVGIPVVDEF